MGKPKNKGGKSAKKGQENKGIRSCEISKRCQRNFKLFGDDKRTPNIDLFRSMENNSVPELYKFENRLFNSIFSFDEAPEYQLLEENKEGSRRLYYASFRKVVEAADVILEVVDARDPLGTRCSQVQDMIDKMNPTKRLVIVINKCDLVPREVLELWLRYFKKRIPAVPFKATVQKQNSNLGQRKFYKSKNRSALALGTEMIMSLLANYSRNHGIRTSISVGVVGMPNVGKSSIINSLSRSKSCLVGPKPGMTGSLQVVQLDSKIRIIDTPGVVLKPEGDSHAALKNVIDLTNLRDPITPANAVLQKVPKQILMKLYDVPDYSSPIEFYNALAIKTGKLKKYGVPDIETVSRILLKDWNKGKIPYYTVPPEEHDLANYTLVSEKGKEFDIDKVETFHASILNSIEHEENIEQNMSSVRGSLLSENVAINSEPLRSSLKDATDYTIPYDPAVTLEGNQQLNKAIKKRFKRAQKQKGREEKLSSHLSAHFETLTIFDDPFSD